MPALAAHAVQFCRHPIMIRWIHLLLIIAAVASLLGFPMLAGAAVTGAWLLIGVVLVLFLLVLFGLIVVA